jgi:hypothetical protein
MTLKFQAVIGIAKCYAVKIYDQWEILYKIRAKF